MNKKMTDVDIDPFGEHELRPEEPTDEHIPLDLVTPGRSSTWEEIAKSTEDLIFQINNQSQTDDLFEHPLRELLGLDKQLRSIRGSLKVEVAKKLELEERIAKEHHKLEEFREYPGVYDDAMKEDIAK